MESRGVPWSKRLKNRGDFPSFRFFYATSVRGWRGWGKWEETGGGTEGEGRVFFKVGSGTLWGCNKDNKSRSYPPTFIKSAWSMRRQTEPFFNYFFELPWDWNKFLFVGATIIWLFKEYSKILNMKSSYCRVMENFVKYNQTESIAVQLFHQEKTISCKFI